MTDLSSRINLTPLLDVIFIVLFVVLGGIAARESHRILQVDSLAAKAVAGEQAQQRLATLVSELDATQARAVRLATELSSAQSDLAAHTATARDLETSLVQAREAMVVQAKRLADVQSQNAALSQQLTDVTAAMKDAHRTIAAAKILNRQYKVFELTVSAESWMQFSGPGIAAERQRITPSNLDGLLANTAANGSVVLLFLERDAVYRDVLLVRETLRQRGFAFQEYQLPSTAEQPR
jgi:biopolymer transport protein ExbD